MRARPRFRPPPKMAVNLNSCRTPPTAALHIPVERLPERAYIRLAVEGLDHETCDIDSGRHSNPNAAPDRARRLKGNRLLQSRIWCRDGRLHARSGRNEHLACPSSHRQLELVCGL